jgi:hypothetical protein
MGFKLPKGDTFETQGIFCRIFPIFLREEIAMFSGKVFCLWDGCFCGFFVGIFMDIRCPPNTLGSFSE